MFPLTRRLTTLLVGASLLTVGLATSVAAQGASESPAAETPATTQPCSLLTADEATAGLGVAVTDMSEGVGDCEFDSDYASGSYVSLFLNVQQDDLGTIRSVMCGGFFESPTPTLDPNCSVDVQVGSAAGIYLPDAMGTLMYVDAGNGALLNLQLVGELGTGVDKQAALTGLAGLALPRVASLPQPSIEPGIAQPSFTADTALEALFPTDIAGQTVFVQSLSGNDLTDLSGLPEEFSKALSDIGKSIDDVSFAIGGTNGTPPVSITAFKVAGADMVALKTTLLPLMYQDQDVGAETPANLGGKDVTSVTVGGTTTYLYPKDDILWVVNAADPALTEIFQKLP